MTDSEPTTKKIRVYGTEYIDVEMKINRDKLTEAQQKLVKQLRLKDYVDVEYKDKAAEGAQWIADLLDEIINKDCRTDTAAILKEPCPNYQAYLLHLAINFKRTGSRKLPYVKNSDIISLKEKLGRDKARKELGKGLGKEQGPTDAASAGDLIVKIHIPLAALIGAAGEDALDALRRRILSQIPPLIEELVIATGQHPSMHALDELEARIRKTMAKEIPELTAV